jgi:serine protease AprX
VPRAFATACPRTCATLALLLAMLFAGAARAPRAAAAPQDATGRLAQVASAHPRRPVQVIVRLAGGRTAAQGRAAIRRHGGRVTGELHIFNGLVARMSAGAAARLQRDPAVAAVSLNAAVHPQSINSRDVRTAYPFAANAVDIWNADGVATTGQGVGVAVIDTGIAGGMPDFRVSATNSSSRVIASAVVNPLATTAGDSYGHGTHVAGIIAGNGNARGDDPLRGAYVGVAPRTNLISVKVADDDGNATVLDVIYGLQFAIDHKDELNIRVANLSLESNDAQSPDSDPLDAAAEAAWFHGIAVVAAAGNRGTADDAAQHAPGNDPYVITVGALDDQDTRTRSDDAIASWSSRGTTEAGTAKPDIYASGSHIVSTLAPGSAFTQLCPECVVAGGYIRAGGTSMSAPVVSGVAALVLANHPGLSPDQLKALLVGSAYRLPDGTLSVDADAAVRGADNIGAYPRANQGLTPNTLIDPASGGIDYSRSSWSRSSWSSATGDLSAGWARSSWSCSCSTTASGGIDPSRSSWSRSSWSTSWTK